MFSCWNLEVHDRCSIIIALSYDSSPKLVFYTAFWFLWFQSTMSLCRKFERNAAKRTEESLLQIHGACCLHRLTVMLSQVLKKWPLIGHRVGHGLPHVLSTPENLSKTPPRGQKSRKYDRLMEHVVYTGLQQCWAELQQNWPPVGHRVGHRIGHRVGHGLQHDLGHGLPHILSTPAN